MRRNGLGAQNSGFNAQYSTKMGPSKLAISQGTCLSAPRNPSVGFGDRARYDRLVVNQPALPPPTLPAATSHQWVTRTTIVTIVLVLNWFGLQLAPFLGE